MSVYVDLTAETTDDPLVKVSEPTAMGPGFPTMSIGSIRPDLPNEGWVGCIDNAFIYEGILTDSELVNLRDRGSSAALGPDDFRITSVVRNSDTSVTLTWTSKPNPGTTYTVLFNSNLEDPIEAWADDDDSVATGGDTTTHTTQVFGAATGLFIKVREN